MMEDIILEFWRCSLRSDFSEFDFDDAFESIFPFIDEKVLLHGQGGDVDEFVSRMREHHDDCGTDLEESVSHLWWAKGNPSWWSFDESDIVDAILRAQYECLKNAFKGGAHGELRELWNRLNNRRGLSEPEMVQLFDECIHAQHETGDILEGIDIEELRAEAEQEWNEEQAEKKKYVTNMREFLVMD